MASLCPPSSPCFWKHLHFVAQRFGATGECHYISLSRSILSWHTHKRQEEVTFLNHHCRQTYFSRPFLFVWINCRRQLVEGGYLSCTADHPLLHWRGLGCCLWSPLVPVSRRQVELLSHAPHISWLTPVSNLSLTCSHSIFFFFLMQSSLLSKMPCCII